MILVAGVGYQHLSDLSFGSVLVERMQEMEWPEDVQIED
ncbi:MAG: hydrogenase maturation protease, partial [Rubrobacter sp.]|nr:hydrogenase maturation protease [Rubrobacter sp.]